jgi:uncharacterized membrane protein YebE (DUF533 family)
MEKWPVQSFFHKTNIRVFQFWEATAFSNSAAANGCLSFFHYNFSALLNFYQDRRSQNHKTIEIARIIFPAPYTNAFVFSMTLIATFLKAAICSGHFDHKESLAFIFIILFKT